MPVDTVLLTGGFGQVGTRCAEILLGRGRTVIVTDLHTNKSVVAAQQLSKLALAGNLVTAYADLVDTEAVRDIVLKYQPGAIVHLAALLSPMSYRNPKLARKVNVEGTRSVVQAAKALTESPLFVTASSAAVYGSRNPYRYPELIAPDTPLNPIDHYGEDKALAEAFISDSGLPYAVLRLGGVISPDAHATVNSDYLLLTRATPGDNRLHAVDVRDVGLAFANAVDRGDVINGKVLLIGGNETYLGLQRQIEDDIMQAIGLGRLGPSASLPGDPEDDRGWSFTGWFDTTESQALLDFQQHDWSDTLAWISRSVGRRRTLLRAAGPVVRPTMRAMLRIQRRLEGRGKFADPWTLIGKKYGTDVLARADY